MSQGLFSLGSGGSSGRSLALPRSIARSSSFSKNAVSWRRTRGIVHLPFPVIGDLGSVNVTVTAWWSVSTRHVRWVSHLVHFGIVSGAVYILSILDRLSAWDFGNVKLISSGSAAVASSLSRWFGKRSIASSTRLKSPRRKSGRACCWERIR